VKAIFSLPVASFWRRKAADAEIINGYGSALRFGFAEACASGD